MAEAIVLGSGTSNGVPMLGYEYPSGYLDNPKNWRTRSSMLIRGPEGNLLIDCAPELRLQMARERLYDIDSVIITHTHADHVMGMDDLRSICIKTRRAVPVISLPRYHDDIRRIYPYAFADFPEGVFVPRFDLIEVQPKMRLCGMDVQTFLVEHGAIPVIGIRIGNFAYITDVSRIPEESMALLVGLDTLFIDAVRRAPHPNHFHLEKALEVSAEIAARKTYLTHLGHDYDHDITNAQLPAGVQLAYDGLKVTF